MKTPIDQKTQINIVTNDRNPSRADVIAAFDHSHVLNFASNGFGTISLTPNQIAWEDGSHTGFMLQGYGTINGVQYHLVSYYRPGDDQQSGWLKLVQR